MNLLIVRFLIVIEWNYSNKYLLYRLQVISWEWNVQILSIFPRVRQKSKSNVLHFGTLNISIIRTWTRQLHSGCTLCCVHSEYSIDRKGLWNIRAKICWLSVRLHHKCWSNQFPLTCQLCLCVYVFMILLKYFWNSASLMWRSTPEVYIYNVEPFGWSVENSTQS